MKRDFFGKKVIAFLLVLIFLNLSIFSVHAEDVENIEYGALEENVGNVENEILEENVENEILEENVLEENSEIEKEEKTVKESGEETQEKPTVRYSVHVQNIGWQNEVVDGMTAGTVGKALAVEGIKIELNDLNSLDGKIEYEAHVQDIGWQESVNDGQLAGTVGKAKAVEAIKIRLKGTISEQYDIYYRVHSAKYGWFDWAKNGELAGTVGFACAMEAVEIVLYEKNDVNAPVVTGKTYLTERNMGNVMYTAHVQNIGWQSKVKDGSTAGTTGKSLGIEAIKIEVGEQLGGSVIYKAHVSGIGWQDSKSDGELAGTTGQSKSIEAICIELDEKLNSQYDVYYRVHAARYGWLGWAKNGEIAGSVGYASAVEAIQIQLVEKESENKPNQTERSYLSRECIAKIECQAHVSGIGWQDTRYIGDIIGTTGENRSIEAMAMSIKNDDKGSLYTGGITYRLHVSDIGWQDWRSDGDISGTVGQGKRAEAVQIKLTGEMEKYCDIYYRAHVSNFGWLGWAKNGEEAGSSGYAYKLEAIQIIVLPKDIGAPGNTSGHYKKAPVVGQEMLLRANLYSSTTPYLILVNRSTHKVGIFQGARGFWNNIVMWDCADGAPSTPTVEGVFNVGSRGYYFDSGASRCFWWTQFKGNYLFHSVLYNKNGTLQDGRVGIALSHGCVRLKIENAKWIYDNIPSGTTVVVYH